MKTLAELQALCSEFGLSVATTGRPSKEPWIAALRKYFWERDHPDKPIPPQIEPMLLSDWKDLDPEEAARVEQDQHLWGIQPKADGVRALLHIDKNGIRVTGRNLSSTTFRLLDYQEHLPHLAEGMSRLAGTILDGELVCPRSEVDTGETMTQTALQAAVAILATTPGRALRIQQEQKASLEFHGFDVLTFRKADVTRLPLSERLSLLGQGLELADNPGMIEVPTVVVGKPAFHEKVLQEGGEGTVWKRLDRPYQIGRRVRHWIKRKRSLEVEALVTAFRPGTPERGHAHLVGALEFSIEREDGRVTPIAWICGWTDQERQAMTIPDSEGRPHLCPDYRGRKGMVTGQDLAARSGRIRHARLVRWLE
jgi:ATP-dependent DNA ligase